MVRNFIRAAGALFCFVGFLSAATVTNPIIWADVPDIAVVHVGTKYYMSSTTMHFTPGVPIMESSDMVNWRIISYCQPTLINCNLTSTSNQYGKGTWASSIRYKSGTFYVLVPSQTANSCFLFTATDPKGPWKETKLPQMHDPSLLLDDDGRNYVLWGGGDIQIIELNETCTATKGTNRVLLKDPASVAGSGGLRDEGTQVYKHNGYYYIFNICWPSGGMRTETCFRGKSLTGSFEGKVVMKSNGVAQGSVVELNDGSWMGYLFQDNGSVGRSPWLVPVTWQDDWPVFNNGTAPSSFNLASAASQTGPGIVSSDDFSDKTLKLEWQFNHNPDDANWSLSEKPGFFRIKAGRVDPNFVSARNTLTQRAFGPKCSGRTVLDVSGMKDGDVAGLGALQAKYGFVGVKKSGTTNTIVMNNGTTEVATAALSQNKVYLRIDMDFTSRTDKATFFYSLDSVTWKSLGNTLQMSYDMPHFVGYRFALFNFGTKSTGGIADFDWFEIGASVNQKIDLYIGTGISPKQSRSVSLSNEYTVAMKRDNGLPVLAYSVPDNGNLEMKIFDLKGSYICTPVNGYMNAGNHSISLGRFMLANGKYCVTMKQNNVTHTIKNVSICE
jgi:beta-xylosidase